MSKVTILPRFMTPDQISLIEKNYKAQFVIESCINTRLDGTGNWVNSPYSIFYTPTAHPQGSNWFAIGYESSKLVIRDGQSVYNADQIKPTLNCLHNPFTDTYHTSTYRNDYNIIDRYGNSIDGGRDYCKTNANLDDYNLGYITIALENNQPTLVFTPH